MLHTKSPLYFLCSAFCLVFVLSACDFLPNSSAKTTAAATPTSVPRPTQSPTPSPTPLPQVQTSCPASGTARAAIMPALALGTLQTVVYTWNQADANRQI